MGSLLASIRAIPKRLVAAVLAGALVLVVALVAVLDSTDTALGLIELAAYICAILGLSAAVTFAVIKISPLKSKSKKSVESA
jgi:hypothetical protein